MSLADLLAPEISGRRAGARRIFRFRLCSEAGWPPPVIDTQPGRVLLSALLEVDADERAVASRPSNAIDGGPRAAAVTEDRPSPLVDNVTSFSATAKACAKTIAMLRPLGVVLGLPRLWSLPSLPFPASRSRTPRRGRRPFRARPRRTRGSCRRASTARFSVKVMPRGRKCRPTCRGEAPGGTQFHFVLHEPAWVHPTQQDLRSTRLRARLRPSAKGGAAPT